MNDRPPEHNQQVALTQQYPDVSLREYLEALLDQRDRATQIASEEREKAAAALRETLRNDLLAGDKALERHIDAQIESIKLALAAQEKFSDEVSRAQKEAVITAFEASSELAQKHNDLIQQQDRDKEKYATKDDLAYLREILTKAEDRELVPREVYDAAISEWSSWRETVETRLVKAAGYDTGKAEAAIKANRIVIVVAGFAVTFITTAAAILAGVLTQ